ncbi:RND transporter [Nocardioides sp.]|uniref:RND transporter n=1 Tax=Nocardioides sp. TaxID=35761 RepID=UPI0035196C9C
MLLVILGAFTGLGLARLEFDTSVATFLGEDDPARKAYAVDEEQFGSDPLTVVVRRTDGSSLVSKELLPAVIGLEGEIAGLPDVAVVYGPGTMLNQLTASAQNVLSGISLKRQEIAAQAQREARGAGLSDAAVARATEEAVQRFDLRYGVLLTRAMSAGLPTLSNQRFIDAVAFDGAEPSPQLRFVIPDRQTIAIVVRPRPELEQAEVSALVSSVRGLVADAELGDVTAEFSGSPVVLAALVQQSEKEVVILTAASFVASGLLLAWGVRRLRGRSRWLGIVVPLVAAGVAVLFDLALLGWLDQPASLVLVAVLPALVGIASDVPIYLGLFGSTRRVTATAVATAAGFAVTAISPVPFLQQLGLLLAVGVLMAWLVAALLRHLVAAPVTGEPGAAVDAPPVVLGERGTSRARVALGGLVLLAGVGWALLPGIPLDADLAGLADGLAVESEASATQEALGVTGQVDVLLVGGGVTAESLDWSRQAREAVLAAHADELRPVLSPSQLLGFLGEAPSPRQIESALTILPPYLLGAVVSEDRTTSVVSFGVVPGDIGEQQRLVASVERLLPPPPAGAEAIVTGVPVVAAREFELLDASRYGANLIGILAPATMILLVLGWRHRRDAATALLAAAVATGLGLLVLRLSGTSLTPLTCALGSLTAAGGCEFTVMLQHRAFPWRSVLVAGATSVVGYLVLLGSELDVMRNFALVLTLSVVWGGLAAGVVARAFPAAEDDVDAPDLRVRDDPVVVGV